MGGLQRGNSRWAIEIKLTSNPSKSEIDRLNKAADLVGASQRVLICRTAEPFGYDSLAVTHPKHWLAHRLRFGNRNVTSRSLRYPLERHKPQQLIAPAFAFPTIRDNTDS